MVIKKQYLVSLVCLALVGAAATYAYRTYTLRLVVPPGPIESLDPAAPGTSEPTNANQPSPEVTPQKSDASLSFVTLPPGFVITVFSNDWSSNKVSAPGPGTGPRLMTLRRDAVYLGVPREGRIAVVKDTNADGRADAVTTFIDDLNRPHNIAFSGTTAYVAAEDAIWLMRDENQDDVAYEGSLKRLLTLPTGGHWTRTVKVIGNKLYISMGSSCNACVEKDEARATIMRCELDGTACATFASGLRNTVDFVEQGGSIYGTDNGRDQLGNTLPPEEVNVIAEGKHYGWPYCYGQRVADTNFPHPSLGPLDFCTTTTAPWAELPAHNAPLGLAFYTGTAFPEEYQGDLFVASHGSWNRQPPGGYKLFRVDAATGQVSDFATGWLDGATVRGRPVGVINYQGGLLVSDDTVGIIYRITYRP